MSVPMVSLFELAEINPNSPKLSGDDMVSFLPMSDVSEVGTTAVSTLRPYREVKSGYTGFCDADVLVAKITPCFENNKIAQAVLPTQYGFGSTEFHVIRPRSEAEGRFLLHFLRQDWVRHEGERRMTGSGGQRRVPKVFLEGLKLPNLTKSEQKRVAAILDQADELRRMRGEMIARHSDLGKAIFFEMFGDVRLNERRWAEGPHLQDIADIASGITKGRKLNGQITRAIPYMTVATVQDGHLKLDEVKTIEATEREIERYRLQHGDILLTEGGDPDKLGRGTMWEGEIAECIHQNHVFRVRVTDQRLNPVFATWLIGSPRGKAYFLKAAKQTTGIASINSTQLKQFPLLLPPIDLQNEFAARLSALKAGKEVLTTAMQQAEALFASLQHRAFRGEL